MPKKFVANKTPWMTWLAASSGRVGMAANAAVWAAAMVSWLAAVIALLAPAWVNQARYGACAATYDSALGPSHAPACADANNAVSSAAAEAYSALSAFHAPAAASNDPGPGPLLSSAECTSGGDAIQIGAVMGTPRAGPDLQQTEVSLMNMIVFINRACPPRALDQGTPRPDSAVDIPQQHVERELLPGVLAI